ncbi:hypothetical protein U1Q18_049144 [Sarracenia purpurea var. burkii]
MQGERKEEKLPPGFRFHPTDEELITYYLINKISDTNFTARAIADVDLNKCEPWDLPAPESIDHLLLLCPEVWETWGNISRWWDIMGLSIKRGRPI